MFKIAKNTIAKVFQWLYSDHSRDECSQKIFNCKKFSIKVFWHLCKYFSAQNNSSLQIDRIIGPIDSMTIMDISKSTGLMCSDTKYRYSYYINTCVSVTDHPEERDPSAIPCSGLYVSPNVFPMCLVCRRNC